jgi:hypothetical protein
MRIPVILNVKVPQGLYNFTQTINNQKHAEICLTRFAQSDNTRLDDMRYKILRNGSPVVLSISN